MANAQLEATHTVSLKGHDSEGFDAYQDGQRVADISSGEECWVHSIMQHEGHGIVTDFMARFKYARPMENAKRWLTFILERMTVAEYMDLREAGKAPLTIATDLGYDSNPWTE